MELRVQMKLGSIAQHLREYLSPYGNPVDLEAAKAILQDSEVVATLNSMEKQALIPLRRVKI